MRDIRPKQSGETSGSIPKAPPRFSGAAVPIAKVQVPDSGTKPKRPLFYRKELAEKKPKVQVGNRERYVILGIFGLVLVVVGMAAIIFLPAAEVELVLSTAPLLVEEDLLLKANSQQAGVIPGTAFFRELTVEGEAPVGSTEVIGSKAKGSAQIVNRSVDPQSIVEHSRLVTDDDQLFYMAQSVTIQPNSRATVVIEADEAGEAGNIEPQTLNFAALDKSAQSLVFAEVTQPLTGGSGETVHVAREDDLAQAKEAAAAKAREAVAPNIRDELPAGWVVLEESWATEEQSFETETKVGDRTPIIKYMARMKVRALGYEQATFDDRLEKALTDKLDEDFMLFPGSISYTTKIEEVDWEKAEAKLATRVTHTTIPKFSLDSLREKLAGRSDAEAKDYLEGLPGVRSANVDLSPFWVRSVPRIERRIQLRLEAEQQPI